MVAGRSELADGYRGAQRLVEEGVDVISAGFPCQDISFAGEGAGLAGSRSGLVWNLLRTIRLVRPRYAVLENVAALLSRGLDQICGHLATVGYDTEWHCIPASAAGAPHQRDRIWIVATDTGGEQHESGRTPISGEIAEELSRSFAHATAMHGPEIVEAKSNRDRTRTEAVANTEGQPERAGLCTIEATEQRRGRFSDSRGSRGWWTVEPAVDRVADGVPNRVDRLRGLGNAVVPQIPEVIGRAIMNSAKD
jgi:DNA (cytosine-5)-methyltransferase 1